MRVLNHKIISSSNEEIFNTEMDKFFIEVEKELINEGSIDHVKYSTCSLSEDHICHSALILWSYDDGLDEKDCSSI